MLSVGISRIGKTRVVFIDPGAKVYSSHCNIVLEKGLLPDVRAICRHYRWTLQQDKGPANTARTTMDYLKKEHINFIEPHMWPPNSPDINPVDYCHWIVANCFQLWVVLLFGYSFRNESTTNDNSRRWKN